MHTWVVSQLCSQHDIMYVSELLKYMCSICFIIYQVVVCACVQVIKVIDIVACGTISFLGTIYSWFTRIILILRHWYYACSHSSSPIAFITSIPCCCVQLCFSLSHTVWYITYMMWRSLQIGYRPGCIDHTSLFSWADTTASGIIITWHIVISYTTSESGELFSSFM